MRVAFAATLVPLLLVAVTRAAAPADAPIVVASTRSATFHDDVFLADSVAGTARNLTRHPASDRQPAASPDGGRIAFISDRSGADAIWMMPATGGAARRVSR